MAKKLQPVVVEWIDILDETGWAENPAPPLKPTRVTTTGFLIERNSEIVVVCRDYHHADANHPTYGGRVAIPSAVVQSISALVVSKRKKIGDD